VEALGETGDWLLATGLLRIHEARLILDEERQLITNEVLVHVEEALEAYVRRETSASQMATR
jgi:hypothetical protein